jgi:hypothetical protein
MFLALLRQPLAEVNLKMPDGGEEPVEPHAAFGDPAVEMGRLCVLHIGSRSSKVLRFPWNRALKNFKSRYWGFWGFASGEIFKLFGRRLPLEPTLNLQHVRLRF